MILEARRVVKIQEEEIYNKAYARIRKAKGCPVCDFCAKTKTEVRHHIKEDHYPEDIIDALNIECDQVI
jgi:hypothetical protein